MEEKEIKCDICGADLNKKTEVETTHRGIVKKWNIGKIIHDKDGNITKAICRECYKKMDKGGGRHVAGGYKDLWGD